MLRALLDEKSVKKVDSRGFWAEAVWFLQESHTLNP